MTPYRDFDGTYKLTGHHQHGFSTEADALAAAALAIEYAMSLCSQESRYRRAAERAQTTSQEN